MAKKRKTAKAVKDTFQDLDVTLNDGLEVEEVKAPKVAEATPVARPAGLYYKGERITKIPSRLGKKWVIMYQGRRVKVLKSELEVVK